MDSCKNPECAAIAAALEAAMADPAKAARALTVLEAKAAEELVVQFDALKAENEKLRVAMNQLQQGDGAGCLEIGARLG